MRACVRVCVCTTLTRRIIPQPGGCVCVYVYNTDQAYYSLAWGLYVCVYTTLTRCIIPRPGGLCVGGTVCV